MWKYIKNKPKKLLRNELIIKKCKKSEYDKLKKFHYIIQDLPAITYDIFGMYHKDILYGIIVYSAPTLELLARSKTVLGKILKKYDKNTRYKFLNKNCKVTGRIVVHPSIRGIGAGSKLVEDTWRKTNVRFVEGLSVMSYYRNFYPNSYSYNIKIKRVLRASEFFYIDPKASMKNRLKTPIVKYGYVLYINDKIKCKN